MYFHLKKNAAVFFFHGPLFHIEWEENIWKPFFLAF